MKRPTRVHLLDIIARFLACYHYHAELGVWQTEVIAEGTEPVVGNFEMKAVPPIVVLAIQAGKDALGHSYTRQQVDQVMFRELEGG